MYAPDSLECELALLRVSSLARARPSSFAARAKGRETQTDCRVVLHASDEFPFQAFAGAGHQGVEPRAVGDCPLDLPEGAVETF